MSRARLFLCLLLTAVCACDGGDSVTGPALTTRRVRLFDHPVPPETDRTTTPGSLSVTPEQVTIHERAEGHRLVHVPLPWPAAAGTDVSRFEFGGDAASIHENDELAIDWVPRRVVIQAESMERSDDLAVRDANTLASRIALPPGSALSTALPPHVAECSAVVILRGESEQGSLVVEVSVNGAPAESHTIETSWTGIPMTLPASADEVTLRVRCGADNPERARLVVKRVELNLAAHDALVIHGPANAVQAALQQVEAPNSRLTYPPRAPDGRTVLKSTAAWATDGDLLRFPVLFHAGTVHVRGTEDARLRAGDTELNGTTWNVEHSGLLDVLLPATSIDPVSVHQPEASRRDRQTRSPLPEPLYDASPGRTLQRIDLGGERRIACVLTPPERIAFDVPPHAPRTLRVGLGLIQESDDGSVPTVSVRFLDAGGDELATAAPPLTAGGWEDWRTDLPDGAVSRIEFHVDGEGYRIADDGNVHQTHVAIANPVLIDPNEKPGGILLYMVDTLRADHMQLYGYERDTTPNLVARESELIVFDHAYSSSSWTRPSTASLLTGMHPSFHGATGQNVLASEVVTLAEYLHEAGYATGAVVTNPNVSGPTLGFEEGFDEFHAAFDGGDDLFLTSSTFFHPWLVDWLERHQNEPFFLYVHSIDPHSPYTPPEEEWRRYDPDYNGSITGLHKGEGAFEHYAHPTPADIAHIAALYDAEIRQNDATIEDLIGTLDRMGLWSETGFLLTSDHGEEFQEHGGWTHGRRAYEEQLHIPMLIKPAARWQLKPGRLDHRIQLTDVAPTVLDLSGIDPTGLFTGRNVTPILRGNESGEPGLSLFFDERPEMHAMYFGDYKLIEYEGEEPRRLLFNVADDPEELEDISAENAKRLESLAENLRDFYVPFHDRGFREIQGSGRFEVMDEATIDRLMQIGYLK